MSQFAKLRDDLIFAEAEIDGQKVVNIKDPITGNYFRLREPEFYLISQLDGETDYDTVAQRFIDKFKMNINAEAVGQFVELLESQFFLENVRSEQKISRSSYGGGEKPSLFSRLLRIRFKAFDPTGLLNALLKGYKYLHTRWGFFVQFLIILFGLGLFIIHNNAFAISINEVFNVGSILIMIATFFILIVIHETSHAIVCRYYGGQVTEMGFLFLYFQPCCYCNLSDAWLFKKKSQRLAVMSAGLYSQFLLLTLAMVVWRVTVPHTFVSEVARLLVVVIWITFIFNLNPLIKLDGYYLLSDWLELPNLRSNSFNYLKNIFQRIILGWPIEKVEITPRQKRIYIAYALFSMLYTALLLGYMAYLVYDFTYQMTGFRGVLLLTALLFYTLRRNIKDLFMGAVKHIKYQKEIMKRPLRLVINLIILAALVILLFFVKLPHRVTGEITIQPIAEFSLLLNDFGLLEKKFRRGGADSEIKSSFLQMTSTDMASLDLLMFVRDGQKVAAGDTLALLVSNQVKREIMSEQSMLEKLQHDLALLKSPPKQEAIDEAISEVNAAHATYEQRQRDEDRLRKLAEKEGTTKERLETAIADTKVAKAEWETKKAKLELLKSPPKAEEEAVIISQIDEQKAKLQFLQTQQDAQSIIAPINGRIVINPDEDEILTILDNEEIELKVPVSDFDINLVWLKQNVKLKVRSYPDKVFEGVVVHVPQDAEVDQNDEAFFKVSAIVENDENLLNKGMTGYAKIEVGKISIFEFLLRRLLSILRVEFWSWW